MSINKEEVVTRITNRFSWGEDPFESYPYALPEHEEFYNYFIESGILTKDEAKSAVDEYEEEMYDEIDEAFKMIEALATKVEEKEKHENLRAAYFKMFDYIGDMIVSNKKWADLFEKEYAFIKNGDLIKL